jgi:hypothetical protein
MGAAQSSLHVRPLLAIFAHTRSPQARFFH